VRVFYRGFQTCENNRIHESVHQAISLFSWSCKTLRTIKTTRPFRPRVFIVFRVLQILENNKNRLVNSLVNSIVLACLETLVKHSHLFMKYYVFIHYLGYFVDEWMIYIATSLLHLVFSNTNRQYYQSICWLHIAERQSLQIFLKYIKVPKI
jgi:hypothetical protein